MFSAPAIWYWDGKLRNKMEFLYVPSVGCCILTYLLTPWSRVLLEKLTGSAASQEILRIFGTRRFITVLTSACHLSLSWANSIQSSQHPPTSWRSILILSSHLHLGLPSGLFPSGFPTRTLCCIGFIIHYCLLLGRNLKIFFKFWKAMLAFKQPVKYWPVSGSCGHYSEPSFSIKL